MSIIFLLLLIFFLLLLVFFIPPPDSPEIFPTLHSLCSSNQSLCDTFPCVTNCGGDLICDPLSSRCKKQLYGSCSSHVDCQSGLFCHNWVCSPHPLSPTPDSPPPVSSHHKKVSWSDHNEIFHFTKRDL